MIYGIPYANHLGSDILILMTSTEKLPDDDLPDDDHQLQKPVIVHIHTCTSNIKELMLDRV